MLGARSEDRMSDVIFVGVTVGFFALAWAYVRGCERV
jgi:hypothetical protein